MALVLWKPGIARVQALADISRSVLCCHSNERNPAPIVSLANIAQLGATLYHSPNLHPGPCSSVGMRPQTNRQTDTHTHTHRRV